MGLEWGLVLVLVLGQHGQKEDECWPLLESLLRGIIVIMMMMLLLDDRLPVLVLTFDLKGVLLRGVSILYIY